MMADPTAAGTFPVPSASDGPAARRAIGAEQHGSQSTPEGDMIRSVAYSKAVLAGMASAVAWEVAARLLIWAGLPVFDIVGTLGTLALPHASAWASWAVGMLLHLLVGAIWAVFYAYFF